MELQFAVIVFLFYIIFNFFSTFFQEKLCVMIFPAVHPSMKQQNRDEYDHLEILRYLRGED